MDVQVEGGDDRRQCSIGWAVERCRVGGEYRCEAWNSCVRTMGRGQEVQVLRAHDAM